MSMDKLDNRYDAPRPESYAWKAYGLLAGYRTADQGMTDIASSSGSSPFPGTLDDMSLLESGLYGNKYGDMVDDYYRFEAEAGKSVDPRLLSLLEFFRELYVRRQELFKKIFPGLHDEFVELSKKIRGVVVAQVEGRGTRRPVATLQRSLSVGSPRTPSNKAGELPLRLERFKVRELTLEGDVPVQGAPQGGNGSGGGQGGASK
ncbi:uncharacterized protein LOC121238614 [Juglans microcarpa x Juglans regia]|uniref:uncharacterized protein LOC121238614 n=1 Tax=Juglans microcarpa x Juglans regia TaxID=2249226 RepID=UPI001B7E4C4A|nr:uncharacterized protein LOC121238614 [Juglans microcarpa x Juglans regia]